jgi:dihydrofolate reductase
VKLEVIYYVATSVDGYIATGDGNVDWLSQFHVAGEDRGAGKLYASIDALLLGSHTYEFALQLGQWPSPDKPSWVFTKRALRILHPSITLTSQSPLEVVAHLTKRGLLRAWLMGGGKLAASFHANELISDYVISVLPILLGSGIPLFSPHSCSQDSLSLVAAKTFKSEVVQLTYRRAEKRPAKRSGQRQRKAKV